MLFLLMIGGACLASFVPLGVATPAKAKNVGSVAAGIFSSGLAAAGGYFFSGMFALAGDSIDLPVVMFGGAALLCVIWTIFLFLTSDDNN